MRWLNKDSETFLKRGYIPEDQSVEQRVRFIAKKVAEIHSFPEMEDRVYEVISKGWCSLSSPIWSNFGLDKGLPISCFGSYIDDSVASILETNSEVGMMSKMGGGTSAYFGKIRERGALIGHNNGKTSGSGHFAGLYQNTVNTISQGSTRRGAFAAYQDIEHKDTPEWLDFRTEGNPIQDIVYGICVGDDWMKSMVSGDSEKRRVWAKLLQRRGETGMPFIFFKDTVNRDKPEVYKDNDLTIYASNLCTEIFLPSKIDWSFVCDLLSMNLLHFDEWFETHAVETAIYILDAVATDFIEKASKIPFLERAVNFCKENRALGLGRLGWHSLLQSKMVPFESFEAKMLNVKIAKYMDQASLKASQDMFVKYGTSDMLKDYAVRHATRLADAPTVSSSFILGQVSPSNEPLNSNYFINDTAKGKFTYKNPFLVELLSAKSKDLPEIWLSILKNAGSVQHLDFLSEHEKGVFKTFGEISQIEIIIQASQRQKYIDQGQSINLMIHPKTPVKDINALYIKAWELGIKTLYYQRSTNMAQSLGRDLLNCTACQA